MLKMLADVLRHIRRRHHRKLVEALANRERATEPRGWWWLSFVDPSKPEGFSFLGVAIVEGHGVGSAALRAHELGVNPGGEVRASRIAEADIPAQQYRNRLLSKGEIDAAGL